MLNIAALHLRTWQLPSTQILMLVSLSALAAQTAHDPNLFQPLVADVSMMHDTDSCFAISDVTFLYGFKHLSSPTHLGVSSQG